MPADPYHHPYTDPDQPEPNYEGLASIELGARAALAKDTPSWIDARLHVANASDANVDSRTRAIRQRHWRLDRELSNRMAINLHSNPRTVTYDNTPPDIARTGRRTIKVIELPPG